MMPSSKNIKIFFNYFLGPVLFIWLSISIYLQIRNQPQLELSWLKIKQALRGEQSWKFWVVLLLMLVNWGVEARKWQILLKPVQKLNWWMSFKAILAGVSFSISTPNGIGEVGGRILYVREGNRIRAVSLSVVGSLSQTLVTLLLGLGGLIFLLNVHPSATSLLSSGSSLIWIQVLIWMVIAAAAVGLLFYLKLGWLVKLIEKVPAFSKFAGHISVLDAVGYPVLLRLLSLSLTRYLVFITQYILLMQLTQVDIRVWQAFWLVSVVYLIMTIVPTIALAEVGIRGKVSLELFGMFSTNHFGIVAASIAMWGINLIVPALMGSVLILKIKIFRNK